MNTITHTELVKALVKPGEDILKSLTPSDCNAWHMASCIESEAGELFDAVKKVVIYRKPWDRVNLVEELGDLEFYMEGLRQELGITRQETLDANIAKLSERYKKLTYSNEAAQERADKTRFEHREAIRNSVLPQEPFPVIPLMAKCIGEKEHKPRIKDGKVCSVCGMILTFLFVLISVQAQTVTNTLSLPFSPTNPPTFYRLQSTTGTVTNSGAIQIDERATINVITNWSDFPPANTEPVPTTLASSLHGLEYGTIITNKVIQVLDEGVQRPVIVRSMTNTTDVLTREFQFQRVHDTNSIRRHVKRDIRFR